MAVTKDAVWVASSSVNHVVRLDAKTNQPGTIVTVAKPCAGLVVLTAREGPLTPVGRGFQQDRMCGHLKKSRYASGNTFNYPHLVWRVVVAREIRH